MRWRGNRAGTRTRYTAGARKKETMMVDTKTFTIKGMTCDNCVQHVTKAIKDVAGVTSVEVSLAAKQAKVEGDFEDTKIIDAVVEEGYEAAVA
jgi:copper chaperone CopZ